MGERDAGGRGGRSAMWAGERHGHSDGRRDAGVSERQESAGGKRVVWEERRPVNPPKLALPAGRRRRQGTISSLPLPFSRRVHLSIATTRRVRRVAVEARSSEMDLDFRRLVDGEEHDKDGVTVGRRAPRGAGGLLPALLDMWSATASSSALPSAACRSARHHSIVVVPRLGGYYGYRENHMVIMKYIIVSKIENVTIYDNHDNRMVL